MKRMMTAAMASILALSLAGCSPTSENTSEGAQNMSINTELVSAFRNPSDEYKPLTRWWVPGSQMEKEEVRKEIESMVNAGFGGAEIVPVSVAGGDGEGQLDWGSDDWKEITKYILETAGEYGFTIDFTMTPAWPLALPTITDVNDPAQGAQMEMDGAYIDGITKDKPFSGVLPVSEEAVSDAQKVGGNVTLIGVTAAKYTDKENHVLSFDSAKSLSIDDVTDNGDGTFSTSYMPEDDGEYVLYAWYQHPSGNQKYENNQVDHYSKAGSQMIIDYWEKELIPYYGDAFKNCRSMFVDSLEFETHLDWTYGLQETFAESNGYDVTAYLPAIYDASSEWSAIGNYMGDPVPSFSFDRNNTQLVNDFKEHLTQLYIENNILPLREFCEKHGITLRYQTSYGKSLDTAETALYPDIPETESLYGNDYMDFYRLQSGAVHAADKKIYSMETSAEWTETWNPKKDNDEYGGRGNGEYNAGNYEQTFQDHLWHDQRAFAAGVNQVVFHGYPYNGQYNGGAVEGTQWPGFTGFESYRWSNSWGERQPNWMFADTYLSFITRNQYILRQGTAKVDAAVYHHSYYETIDFWGPDKIFMTESLEQNGYSYDFIDPAVLDLDNMTVTDGVLNPESAAYKVLIIDSEEDLPYETALRLNEFAKNGLKIVIIGETPDERSFLNDKEIKDVMEELLASENVILIDDINKTADALVDAGVQPAASYSDETLLAAHRADADRDYYFLYNYADSKTYRDIDNAEAVKTTVVLQGKGTPYILNAWTGEITEAQNWKNSENGTEVDVTIAANDSMIIVMSEEVLAEKAEEKTAMKESIEIGAFSLEIESWTMGETVLDTEKTNISCGVIDELKTWKELNEDLLNVSGIGVYTAEFTVTSADQRAYLHMGRVKDAYGVKINGKDVIVDQVSGDAEITDMITEGTNTIEITVATSLLNALLYNNRNILNDDGRVLDDRSPSGYGLTNTVVIDGNPVR